MLCDVVVVAVAVVVVVVVVVFTSFEVFFLNLLFFYYDYVGFVLSSMFAEFGRFTYVFGLDVCFFEMGFMVLWPSC